MNKYVTIGITNMLLPYNGLNVPVKLGNGVQLELFEHWYDRLKLENIFPSETFPHIKRRNYVYTYNSEKCDEYEALELLTIASLSIWLVKPTDVGFDYFVKARYNRDWKYNGHSYSNTMINSYDTDEIRINETDLIIANKINENIYHDVISQDIDNINSLRIAIWSLFKAITTDMHSIPIRYLILWVAFEAIFGPKKNGNIKEKIATRHSKFMSNSDENIRNELYEKTRKGYKWRSKIVHGDQIGSKNFRGEEFSDIYKFTETSIRESIKKILLDNNSVKIFCSDEREKYLDNL